MLGRAEPALWHARRCVELAEADADREDWDLPAAYEAMARAYVTAGDAPRRRPWKAKATEALDGHRRRRGPHADRAGRPRAAVTPAAALDYGASPTPTGGPAMTDLKTGILLWSQGASWPEQLEAAQRVDRLGYDHLWTWDHLYAIFGDPYQPIFEGWTSLAAWAMATERTRLGLLVGANTFRNPGLVAKTAATLDHISGGRAILGIGGAWMELEHQAHGIDFGSGFGQRLDWLDESVGGDAARSSTAST